ncbi:CT392 family protein [Chlamydia gallinacea]|uniref:CT392 family protein n=1 Tax=Chlamydia gallinacea TaxID=1457153 RepID=UPI0009901F6E|nr:hypothetical protein [Chlamydia gallinacea]AQT77487.1 hypothetical protein B1F83_02450 [Chlamydia gallinacea]
MSTISGNSGNSASSPEEPNLIPPENQENSSQEQSVGFTSSGLSVRPATSSTSVVLRDPKESQAVLVEDAARSAMQQGTLVSGLTPSTSAATEAATMLANVEQGEAEAVDSFILLPQNYQEFMALVVNLEEKFNEVCRELNTYREQRHSSSTSSTRKLKRADRSNHLEAQYQCLRSSSEELKNKSAYLVSCIADCHKAVMGKSSEEVSSYLGERGEVLLGVLSGLGVEYSGDEGEWKISPDGMVLKCHELILRLHACIDEYHVEDISEKQQSVCQTVLNKFMTFWETAINLFHELMDRVIFFLLWLIKIVRDRLGGSKNVPENPYAAIFIQNQERQSSSTSLRSTVSGRGDLGDEEGIFRSDSSSMNMQSSDEESRGEETPVNKRGKNKGKK